MKGNKGIIGPSQIYSNINGTVTGVSEIFDQYTNRGSNTWPPTVYYTSLSPNSGTIYENSYNTFVLTTSGITLDTTLYWTINYGTADATAFYASIVSGSFTQSASTQTGTFYIGTSFTGNTGKTAATFTIQIRTGSTSGTVVYTSGTFTIPAVTIVAHNWVTNPVNEGTLTYTQIQFGNCSVYAGYYFYIYSIGGTATNGTDYGTLTVGAAYYINPGSVTNYIQITPTADLTTEGNETLIITIYYTFNSVTYTYSTNTLTITDSSTTPTVTITPSTTSVTEGNSVTFTITVSGSYTGTVNYQVNQVSGTITAGDFTDVTLSGSVSITSGSGSLVKTLASDGVTEGTEQFTVSIKRPSDNAVLATSSTISVTDAAATTPYKQGIIFGGFNGAYLATYLTVDSAGTFSADTSSAQTARRYAAGSAYGNDKGFALAGTNGSYLNSLTLISSTAVLSAGTATGNTCYGKAAARYGTDKAVTFGGYYQVTYGYTTYTNYYTTYQTVSNTGTFSSETASSVTGRVYAMHNIVWGTASANCYIYSGYNPIGTYVLNYFQVNSSGVFGSQVSITTGTIVGVGLTYGSDKALIVWGGTAALSYNATYQTVSNTGVIGASTGISSFVARQGQNGVTLGCSTGMIFAGSVSGGTGYTNVKNSVSSLGVIAADTATTNSNRSNGANSNYGQ